MENYNECLHCPTVHPELVAVVPTFLGLLLATGSDPRAALWALFGGCRG